MPHGHKMERELNQQVVEQPGVMLTKQDPENALQNSLQIMKDQILDKISDLLHFLTNQLNKKLSCTSYTNSWHSLKSHCGITGWKLDTARGNESN